MTTTPLPTRAAVEIADTALGEHDPLHYRPRIVREGDLVAPSPDRFAARRGQQGDHDQRDDREEKSEDTPDGGVAAFAKRELGAAERADHPDHEADQIEDKQLHVASPV